MQLGITEAARLELHGSPVRLSMVMPGVANTELASGVKNTRGVPRAEPEEVAAAVVDAVRHGRFEVFVPRRLGPISKLMTVFPRTLRELGVRALGLDRMLLDVDESARRAYNERTMPSALERKGAEVSASDRIEDRANAVRPEKAATLVVRVRFQRRRALNRPPNKTLALLDLNDDHGVTVTNQ